MLYRLITDIRNTLYDKGFLPVYRSSLPVICVGNITAGGNGKTPLVIFLTEYLQQQGKRPVILSRGYGGSEKGPYAVQMTDSAERCGDEPCMLRQRLELPVVVARDRVVGAQYIEREALGDVIVLDDGFQHRRLGRDLNIVTAYIGSEKAVTDFLQGRLLPFGRFREEKQRALGRADVVVFSHRKPKESAVLDERLKQELPEGLPVVESFLEPIGVFNAEGQKIQTPGEAVAFSAIAQPESFYQTLRSLGFTLVATYPFADHHQFTTSELNKLITAAGEAPLICTEKDLIKIPANLKKHFHHLSTQPQLSDSSFLDNFSGTTFLS